jgi:membrane-associated phospholipid phosphatase
VTAAVRPHGLLVTAAACFAALAGAVALLGALPADAAVRDALLALATPGVVTAMRVVNAAGDWRALLPGTLALFVVFPRARAQWWVWALLMAAAPIMETVFKVLIGRPRPENVSLGFPSGHATAAAAFFGAVMILAGSLPPRACPWVRALATLMILLVGAARVILRAHWPSDVLAGIALGLALAAAAALLAGRRRRPDAAPSPSRS